MTPKQRRLFEQLRARFDFTIADRLRVSLEATGDTAGLASLDDLQKAARLPRYTSVLPDDVADVVYVDGAEFYAKVVGRHVVDLEDGLRKPWSQCDMPKQRCELELTPTGGTRKNPRAVLRDNDLRREVQRAAEVATYRAAHWDPSA